MIDNETDNHKTGVEIAVIGMAARFPGAGNIGEFWDNISKGNESLTFFSDDELRESKVSAAYLENPAYVRAYGWLTGIEFFDYSFFAYTPLEAELMDPQVCLLHECALEALEHAGYDCFACEALIGLYAGASHNLQWQIRVELSGKTGILGGFASIQLSDKDFLATRIAYRLSLKGPSVTLDTACSTSLVAIHMACQGLLAGDCDMALAGGVSTPMLTKRGYLYKEGMLSAPDGHCHAFDAQARGCNFGNGVGLVVLKRLEEAEADGDTIHAVIKGSSINNDGGRKSGYTAPSIEGQAEVIRNALEMAEVGPETIGYVETHGTGTPLGDPVEIEGLKTAFNTDKKHFCRIGSVKTNIGHLEVAAGIAGFIKTVLVLKHHFIPPTLFFKTPNPKIDFENSPFVVNTRLTPWERGQYPRRAGVSSFGIGGTNAHVVLEEAARETGGLVPLPSRQYHLLLFSARSETALDNMTGNLADYFQRDSLNQDNRENPLNPGLTLADAAYTLQVGRALHPHRRILVSKDAAEAVQLLSDPGSGKVKTLYSREDNRPVVFMFSGLGAQYVDMGRDLYRQEPIFRREMDRCFEILAPLLGHDIKALLYPAGIEKSDSSDFSGFEVAQAAVFIFEYSLARLVMAWGIKPHAVIGYSFGEYAAACTAGVFSLEDALKLVVARGKLIQKLGEGAMLSVPLGRAALAPYLNPEISLAIDNGPSCIVSGPVAAVEAFEEEMKEKRLLCMRLPVSRALHSRMMAPILPEFAAVLETIRLNPPQIPMISNVSGDWLREEEVVRPRYWGEHLSSMVRFAEGMKVLLKEPGRVWVEIGPGRDISALTQRYLEESGSDGHLVINLVRQSHQELSDVYLLLNRLGLLWLWGQPIDWRGFYGEEQRQRIPLPTYPFEGQRCWIEREVILEGMGYKTLYGEAKTARPPDFADWFHIPTWSRQALLRPVQPVESPSPPLNCLVFLDEVGIGLQLAHRLKQEGHRVITVTAGTRFLEQGVDAYTLCPRQSQDYMRLFQELRTRAAMPHRVVHLWGVTAPEPGAPGPDWSEETQDRGFYSLIHIAAAIAQGQYEALHLDVVTTQVEEVDGRETLSPAKATIIGPLRVIPQELPGIRCRGIDILLPAAGDSREENAARQLWEEILTPCPETVIAYRGNFRWVQTFKPVRLEDTGTTASKLRPGGIYLVTGGLGKIGFILARYLARKLKAKLVLTGRSAFPAREAWDQWLAEHGNTDPTSTKIRQMKELEEAGAEFRVFSVDTADKDRMRQVIDQARREWGPLAGVIHAAGLMNPKSFRGLGQLDREGCREHFRAKIQGTLILRELLEHREFDFVLFLSSISTVLGGLHFTAYAAANAFMDAFARKYNRVDNGRWIAVDWDGMEEEKTCSAFERILSLANLHQVVAANGGNLQERIERWVNPDALQQDQPQENEKSKTLQSRPTLASSYITPGTAVERKLADIWQRLFGLEPIGIEDDFIELGGDSLKAILMINQAHKELNVTVPLVEFFNRPTIRQLARYIDQAEINVYHSIVPGEQKDYYPLASAQKRLFILHRMNPGTLGYNLAATVRLEGEIDTLKVEQSFRRLIRRHETLRTSFPMVKGEPVQRIHDRMEFAIEYYDLVSQDLGSKEKRLPESIITDFLRPFDLSRTPLLRVALITTETHRHILVVDMHHILHDGISQTILLKEFTAAYAGEELPGLSIRYRDYAQWQGRNLRAEAIKKQEEYWLNGFRGEIPVLNLPYDYPRPGIQRFEGNSVGFELSPGETRGLRALAQSGDATLFMVILSIYYIFLAGLSGQEDIVVGTPEAGRRHPDLQPLIGFFLSTLALRNQPAADKSVLALLKEVRTRTLEAFANQDYPFEELVERVAVNRDLSRSPLFDVMFIFHSQWASRPGAVPETPVNHTHKPVLKPHYYEKNTSEFDLTLIGFDAGDRLFFKFEYCTGLFKEETLRRFSDYFRTLCSAVLQYPHQLSGVLAILPEAEKTRLLQDFNDTAAVYARDKTLPALFSDQVERTPDQVALVGKLQIPNSQLQTNSQFPIPNNNQSGEEQLSYRELQERSNRLAGLLQEKGVAPGTLVGILVQRTPALLVGLWGILKAGGAYLPLDPQYPRARITYILQNSGTTMLLTQSRLMDECRGMMAQGEIIDMTDENRYTTAPPGEPGTDPASRVSPLDPAYVIYTSGSTGNPKGVVVRHQNGVNFITGMKLKIDFSPGSAILALTTVSFDIFFLETLLPLSSGLKVVIAGEAEQQDPQLLARGILRQGMEMVQVTPSRLQLLLSLKEDLPWLSVVETVIVGGEAFPLQLFKELSGKFPGKIYNVYGPTETTIWSTVKDLTGCQPGELTIGTPIANTRIYIVNPLNRPQPPGVAGALLIGGDGVAAGYLNNPELTGDKFDHDFSDYRDYHDKSSHKKLLRGVQGGGFLEKNPPGRRRQKIYRTGDLARWLADGEIEFLGRMDHQVKIRGFRIELEEIEEQLLNHDQIKETVVVPGRDKDGNHYLSAYVVPRGPAAPDLLNLNVSALREYLSVKLPDYMIPAYFVPLEQIPLTPNGKIDRSALPGPGEARPQLEVAYLAPGNEMEQRIARIWQEELQKEKIGMNDNYFHLGGNSMSAIKLIDRMNREFEKNIPLVSIFTYRTIRSFSGFLDHEEGGQLALEDRHDALKRGDRARKKRFEMRRGSRS